MILLGNLANNDAVRELYFGFLLVADCRYPRPGFLIGLENGQAHWVQFDTSGAIQSSTPWKTSGDWLHAVAQNAALLVPTVQGLAMTTLSVENT